MRGLAAAGAGVVPVRAIPLRLVRLQSRLQFAPTLLVVPVCLAVAAPAQAIELQRTDGRASPQPYQRWVDQARWTLPSELVVVDPDIYDCLPAPACAVPGFASRSHRPVRAAQPAAGVPA
jgi:hypothetical protein